MKYNRYLLEFVNLSFTNYVYPIVNTALSVTTSIPMIYLSALGPDTGYLLLIIYEVPNVSWGR